MDYRTLGRTGLKVSSIGLGTEYLVKQDDDVIRETISLALREGVNYFDLVFNYPKFLRILGETISEVRENVILASHIGCGIVGGKHKKMRKPSDAEQSFTQVLSALNTDYTDVAIIQYVARNEYTKIMGPDPGERSRGLKQLGIE